MSASWDADREGSLLGTEEFQRNVNNIKDGLSRSRENAVLRDRMVNISDAELKGLESRDAAKMKKQQSFSEKINDDLD
jgi:Photosynthesis affected mutant 68